MSEDFYDDDYDFGDEEFDFEDEEEKEHDDEEELNDEDDEDVMNEDSEEGVEDEGEGEGFQVNIIEDEDDFAEAVLMKKAPTKEKAPVNHNMFKALKSAYAQMLANTPRVTIDTFRLSFLSEEEKEKLAAALITRVKDSGEQGTLYDKKMGPIHPNEICVTCKRTTEFCPGHCGRILVPTMLLPPTTGYVIQVLKSICYSCGKPIISDAVYEMKEFFRFEGLKRLAVIADLADSSNNASSRCENLVEVWENGEPVRDKEGNIVKRVCNEYQRKYLAKGEAKNVVQYQIVVGEQKTGKTINLFPEEILKIFDHISDRDAAFLGFGDLWKDENGEEHYQLNMHPRNFILKSILIPPNRIRPRIEDNSGSNTGDWTDIVDAEYKSLISLYESWLQAPDEMTRQAKANKAFEIYRGVLVGQGKQKAGKERMSLKMRYRAEMKNVMGARGEQAARSVITAGNWVGFGHVGVPKFAKRKITFPERVFSRNQKKLQHLLRKGEVKYIVRKSGENAGYRITVTEKIQRNYVLQIGDVVRRELQNNDPVWFGRQPSLSKGSLQVLRAVIIDSNTFKFGLPHTKSYNADFDGDEMTIYVPQTVEQVAEALELASPQQLIVAPHSLQVNQYPMFNAISSLFVLTQDNRMVKHSDFYNMFMMIGNRDKKNVLARGRSIGYTEMVKFDIPLKEGQFLSIHSKEYEKLLKGKGKKKTNVRNLLRYFPGRLLFSALLPEDFVFNMGDVEIVRGVLRNGQIFAKHLKAITQALINDYDVDTSAQFIDDATQVSDAFMKIIGMSVGFKDLIPQTGQQLTAQKVMEEARKMGMETMNKTIAEIRKELEKRDVKIKDQRDLYEELEDVLEKTKSEFEALGPPKKDKFEEEERVNNIMKIFSYYNDTTAKLANQYGKPESAFFIMLKSGAKGSEMNFQRIMATTGQQTYRGGLPEANLAEGRTNIYTPKDSVDPCSQGLCSRSFTQGFNPIEWVFNAISGREGLTDTQTQTAKAGESFKSLIKSLENIFITVFGDVRDNAGNMISFTYPFAPESMEFIEINKKRELTTINMKRLVQRLNAKQGYDKNDKPLPEVEYAYRVLHAPKVGLVKTIEMSERDDFMMKVQDSEGKTVMLQANYYEPLRDVAQRLAEKKGTVVEDLHLTYKGQVVDLDKYMADYVGKLKPEEDFLVSMNKGAVALVRGSQSQMNEESELVRTYKLTGGEE